MSDRVMRVCFWVSAASLVAYVGGMLLWWWVLSTPDQLNTIGLIWLTACLVTSLTALIVAWAATRL